MIRACGRHRTSDRSTPHVVRKPCLEVTESIIRVCGRHRTGDRSTPHDRSVDPAHGAKASDRMPDRLDPCEVRFRILHGATLSMVRKPPYARPSNTARGEEPSVRSSYYLARPSYQR